MAVDIKYLKSKGISSGEYKRIFTNPKKPARVQKLIDLIASRTKDGYERCLADYRIYAAIDLAYDTPFQQTTPTFIQNLMSRKLTADELLKEVERMGMKQEDLFLSVTLPNGAEKLMVNEPVIYKIIIPAVRAYCTARIAALFNARNTSPLLPFHPLKKTSQNRVVCEIATDLVQQISTWYGYPSYLDQSIKQTVKYGTAVSFPCEEWDCQKQVKMEADKEKTITEKEGLRYLFPHPTRMFYDLYHPATTMNTGTGVAFAGHWQVVPYSDVLDNRQYWNRDCVDYGTNWFNSKLAGNYFTEFFPCRMQHPVGTDVDALREDKAAFYSKGDRDKATFLTHIYMNIVPKTFGLGKYETGEDKKDRLVETYDYPVWHHFIIAGDKTVIWAEPCAYNPNWFMGYDYDAQSGRQTSLGLESIPWQDYLSNILSQMALTTKQNLANVIFYDTNAVSETDVKNLQNLGERKYRSLNFLKFDSFKANKGVGSNPRDAFVPVQLNYRTIQDSVQMMSTVLSMMERVLQFTAQEVGSVAQHYQSAQEVKITNQSSSSRVNYIGASIDAGIDAWKRQIWTAAMAYKDSEFTSEVSSDIPDVEKVLEDLGFKVIGKTDTKLIVKGDKSKLNLDEFAKSGEGLEVDSDQATAQVMFQTLGVISANELLFRSIGVKRIVSLLEQAARIAGADRDFKLPLEKQDNQPMPPSNQPGQPQQPQQPNPQDALIQQIAPLLQQMQQSILKVVEEKVAQPAAQEMVKQEQQIQQLGQIVVQLEAALKQIAQPPQPQIPPQAVQPPPVA